MTVEEVLTMLDPNGDKLQKRDAIFAHFRKVGHDRVEKADESYIRVMTSNVLFSNAQKSLDFGADYYKTRAEILAAQYLYFKPDFIGMQEITADMKAEFLAHLSDVYAFVDSPTGEKCKRGEWMAHRNYTPLAYNKHLYDVVESRYHVFVEQSCFSYQWAMYAFKKDPSKRVIHMNLHYFYEVNELQLPGFRDVHAELVHLRRLYPRIPIFVTGDYNCWHTHPHFDVMLGGLNMQSGMLVAEDVGTDGTAMWCHSILGDEPLLSRTAIDHVSVTTDLADVKVHRVLYDDLLTWASDHSSRFLDLKLK